jgi:selenocysteine lyase/cysteine desulfurase
MTYDAHSLRRAEFPWALRGDSVYLNNASNGPLPERAARALERFVELRREPFRMTLEDEWGTLRRARELCARLVAARPTEIALMPNTTHGLNVAALALPLAAGDVVLTFDGEFPANVYPWMALGRRGVRLERVPCIGGLPDEDGLHAALDRPGVRAVTVSWVQFSTGYRTDLARLGRACRERGIFLVVDAMQGIGAAPLDARASEVDFLACGGQKWLLAPWGSGFLYVSEELARTLEPAAVGWLAMRGGEDLGRLTEYDFAFRDDARRFEVNTLPAQDFAAMVASLELLEELGLHAIEAHVRALADRVVAWARARGDVEIVTPADAARRLGIVALRPPGGAAAAAARLARAGVACAVREGAVRLSPHCYNTAEDVDRALAALGGA